MKIHTHALCLDTNVFKKIFRKGNELIFDNLFLELNKAVNPKNEFAGYYSTVTPFLVLEYLGEVPVDISIEQFTDEEKEKFKDGLKQEVFKRAETEYKKQTALFDESLRLKNTENKNYVSVKAERLYADVVESIVNRDGFSEEIRFNLALDFTYRFDYASVVSAGNLKKINVSNFYDVFRSHKAKTNFAQTRGIIKLVEDVRRRNSNHIFSEGAKTGFAATQGIKLYRDLFDLDLVQLSCLGVFIDEKKYPVIMITADSKEEVCSRVRLFKSTFNFFNAQAKELKIAEKNSAFLEPIEVREGKIAFVDPKSFQITEVTDVSELVALD